MKFIKNIFGLLKGADLILHSLEKLILLEQTLVKAIKHAEEDIATGKSAIDAITSKANEEKEKIKTENDKHESAISLANNALSVITAITKVEKKN